MMLRIPELSAFCVRVVTFLCSEALLFAGDSDTRTGAAAAIIADRVRELDPELRWPCSFLPFADGGGGTDERSFSVPGGDDLPPDGPLRLPADVRDLLPGVGSALALPPLPGGENCLF